MSYWMCFINQESIIGEAINLNMMYLSTCNVMQLTGWAQMLITRITMDYQWITRITMDYRI